MEPGITFSLHAKYKRPPKKPTDGLRKSACHLNTGLYGIGDLVQIHMAGHDLAVGAHHAAQRALQLFLGIRCV